MRFRFLENHRTQFPVRVKCAMLEVSPSGDYAWRRRREGDLVADIRRVHADNRTVYGSPRVHAALQAEGRRVGG